jgi:hypothetical protein
MPMAQSTPAQLEAFGVEALPVGEEDGQGPLGNLGFVAYTALEYDTDEIQCGRR